MSDLGSVIDWKSVECLNQKPNATISNALKQGYREDDELVLESDTDDQLLIHIPFNQSSVKLSSIIIKNSSKPAQAPKHIKLFTNSPTIGFSEATDRAGVLELDLDEDQLKGEPIKLPLVKFNKVFCLTIFIASNQEDEDTTVIQKLAIFGSAGDSFNVSEIKDISKEQE